MDATGLLRAPTFGIGEEVFDDKTDFEIDWVLLYDFSQIGMWTVHESLDLSPLAHTAFSRVTSRNR